LEGDFSCFAALGTGSGEHLTTGTAATTAASKTLGLPGLTALGAAFRFVRVAFRLEKFLVFSTERKGRATIGTCEGLILKSHWMTSSLLN
jgi:hypothetical protein